MKAKVLEQLMYVSNKNTQNRWWWEWVKTEEINQEDNEETEINLDNNQEEQNG